MLSSQLLLPWSKCLSFTRSFLTNLLTPPAPINGEPPEENQKVSHYPLRTPPQAKARRPRHRFEPLLHDWGVIARFLLDHWMCLRRHSRGDLPATLRMSLRQ